MSSLPPKKSVFLYVLLNYLLNEPYACFIVYMMYLLSFVDTTNTDQKAKYVVKLIVVGLLTEGTVQVTQHKTVE